MNDTTIEIRRVDLRIGDLLRSANRIMGARFLPLVGLSTLAILAIGFVPIVLEGALVIGLIVCFKRVRAGEDVSIETLFGGFQFFVETLLARLLLFGIHVALSALLLPLYGLFIYGAAEHHDGIIALAMLLFFMAVLPLAMFIQVMNGLTFAVMADHNVKGLAAVKLAARGMFFNPAFSAKLGAASLAITILGMLLCGVGFLVAYPIMYLMIWLAAEKMFVSTAPAEPAPELSQN